MGNFLKRAHIFWEVSQPVLIVQSQYDEQQSNVWNLLKVNDKDARTTVLFI